MRRNMGSWWSGKGAFMRLPIFAPLFLAALWTLIFVTLLSALAPLGPPLSRVTGSAFNPATAEVVLKARTQATSQMAQAPLPDGDGAPPLILALALAVMLLAFHIVRPVGAIGRYDPDLPALTPARTRRARAPPAAS